MKALLTAVVAQCRIVPSPASFMGLRAGVAGPYLDYAPAVPAHTPWGDYCVYSVIPAGGLKQTFNSLAAGEAVTLQFDVLSTADATALNNCESLAGIFHRRTLTLGSGTFLAALIVDPPRVSQDRILGPGGVTVYRAQVRIKFTSEVTY